MKLVLADPTYLRDSIGVISELVNEANFKITKEGLELVAMDPANVAMVLFKLLSSNFAEYDVETEQHLSINLTNLKQVLKRAKANDMLKLELSGDGKLNIELKSDSTRTFSLPLLDVEEKEQKIPNLTFPSTVDMSSSVLSDAVEDSNIVGESVTLSLEPLKFTIRAESESTHANIEIPAENGTKITSDTTAKVKSKYSVEYLKKMMLGSKLSDNVTLHLNQDYPLKLEYKVLDKLSLSFILAPRVDND